MENYHDLAPDTKPPAYILKHQLVHQRVASKLQDNSEWLLLTKICTLEACDPDLLFSSEIQKIIDTTLNQLPKKTRRIFYMSRVEALSYNMISEKMNLSQKSIEYHISKALDLLRKSLKDYL